MNFNNPHAQTDLEINEGLNFQRRQWTLQRVGWVTALVLIVLACLGLFGEGPIGNVMVSSGNVRLEFDRFGRLGRETRLNFQTDLTKGKSQHRLWLSRRYLERVRIERIEPEPDSSQIEADRIAYYFRTVSKSLNVSFIVRPEAAGRLLGIAGSQDAPTVPFEQFIYP